MENREQQNQSYLAEFNSMIEKFSAMRPALVVLALKFLPHATAIKNELEHRQTILSNQAQVRVVGIVGEVERIESTSSKVLFFSQPNYTPNYVLSSSSPSPSFFRGGVMGFVVKRLMLSMSVVL